VQTKKNHLKTTNTLFYEKIQPHKKNLNKTTTKKKRKIRELYYSLI